MTVPEVIQLRELPYSLIDGAKEDIAPFVVGFCRIEVTRKERYPVLLGSGTLIKAGDRRAILTAEHVIRELPKEGRLGLLLEPTRHESTIDLNGVSYLAVARGKVDADGPDLGAVLLSPSIADAIAAKKRFYDLDRYRERLLNTPPDRDIGFWFVNGFPASDTIRERDDEGPGDVMRFHNLSGAGGPDEPVLRGEHDYYRFPVTNRDGAPESFGGMSGGGFWQVPISRDASGKLIHRTPLLSGVVYYQIHTRDELALLCHGRRSVYEIAYNAISEGRIP